MIMSEGDRITYVALAIIGVVFIYYVIQLCRMVIINKIVKNICGKDDALDMAIDNNNLRGLAVSYKRTISISLVGGGMRSNIPAQEFFNELSVLRAFSLNLKQLDSASSILVGLGLLGTFLGLTIGIQHISITNTNEIMSSIQTLLDGMGTAFATSLVGMGVLLYTMS